jgi:uncharacterized protein YndB with AHSA1/START domain
MDTSTLTATASVRVHKPPKDVFNAFVDPNAMSKFWFARRDKGLVAGKSATWALGTAADAFAFEILVKELQAPHLLVMEWENGPAPTKVVWTFTAIDTGSTILKVVESGYAGTEAEQVAKALDSTGGFNQVIIAAKAWIEHGVALNVVADHA